MGYSRKEEVERHGISGVLKEKKWKFQGSIKKEVEIPELFKKT